MGYFKQKLKGVGLLIIQHSLPILSSFFLCKNTHNDYFYYTLQFAKGRTGKTKKARPRYLHTRNKYLLQHQLCARHLGF